MSENILFLTKDAFGKFYFPVYGNNKWSTPNLNELAAKGTVFNRHYTAAPSSARSYFSMFTGLDPYMSERKDYIPISKLENIESKFYVLHSRGYECHILWDSKWMTIAKPYAECFGSHVTYNSIEGIRQPVGSHSQHKNLVECDENLVEQTFEKIEDEVKAIISSGKKVFLWMHLPHVHNGRNGYGSDVDVFDRTLGMLRRYFDDDNIYISADHGNMNGTHDKIGYGFDVYEAAAAIPLITPRIEGMTRVDFPTVNTDIVDIILSRQIPRRDFVLCDSAYYCQLNRKLAIIKGKYKYIYNRRTRKEELYDVLYDPHEDVNLISDWKYDVDRHLATLTGELFYYDSWEELPAVRAEMRRIFKSVWREAEGVDKFRMYKNYYGKNIWRAIRTFINRLGVDYIIHK